MGTITFSTLRVMRGVASHSSRTRGEKMAENMIYESSRDEPTAPPARSEKRTHYVGFSERAGESNPRRS